MSHIRLEGDILYIETQERRVVKIHYPLKTKIKQESIYGYSYNQVDLYIDLFLKYMTKPHRLQYFDDEGFSEAVVFIRDNLRF